MFQSSLTPSVPEYWYKGASWTHSMMCAALYMTFFGTQPTLTQVPPSAPFSQTATLAPCVAARRAEAMPPEPAPMTR